MRLVLFLALMALAGPARASVASSTELPLPSAAQGRASALDLHALAVEAYRKADWRSARTLWTEALDTASAEAAQGASALDRAAVCYDLGNAAYRLGELPSAVAWYTAALELDPRHADARANLSLARRSAGLEPADRGDLEAALVRAVTIFTPSEAEWLALACVGLAALALGYEALRGGVLGRRLVTVALGVLVLGLAPWLYALLRARHDPWMVVSPTGTTLRAEPRATAGMIGELQPAQTIERVDTWPEWIKVETGEGPSGWIRADDAQPLRP